MGRSKSEDLPDSLKFMLSGRRAENSLGSFLVLSQFYPGRYIVYEILSGHLFVFFCASGCFGAGYCGCAS